jgi:osmotically-inducible protein OsmY
MANYYDREEDRYRGETRYRGDAGYRGERYGGAYERDSGWEGAGEREGRYGAGWSDDYGRGYGSRYYTGDDQGKGFTGGRDLGGRSYRSSYDRDWAETPSSERGYNREYGRSYGSAGFGDRQVRESEREYQGTFRPPNYGRDFQTNQRRTYGSENTAADRDWLDRASDEVSSWFGDDEAERRRRMDKMRDRNFRGRGPKGYRRSDERIREDVNDRLTDHAYLDASDIDVNVKEGEVTLSGKVFDRTDKRLAEDVAESVTGVKNVQNNLRTDKNWDSDITARSTSAKAVNA